MGFRISLKKVKSLTSHLCRCPSSSVLELTWNKGTEKDANQKYHNGNDQPQGFGHLCISVPGELTVSGRPFFVEDDC